MNIETENKIKECIEDLLKMSKLDNANVDSLLVVAYKRGHSQGVKDTAKYLRDRLQG